MPFSISKPQIKHPSGIIIYRGPSMIDGKPIVVIATGFNNETSNIKTGKMIQTWILPVRINPLTSVKLGKDRTICGNCKHSSKGNGGMGTCYVAVHQAPYNIWRAWKNGNYQMANIANIGLFYNQNIRLGSYGDPLAVPIDVWETVTQYTKGYTGYTHLYRMKHAEPYKRFCMASTDTIDETIKARQLGWRTFRVRYDNNEVISKEFVCPASKEENHRLDCATCLACHGGNYNRTSDGQFKTGNGTVTITVHGRKWKQKRFELVMKIKKMKKGWKQLTGTI